MTQLRRLDTRDTEFEQQFAQLVARHDDRDPALGGQVAEIIAAVRAHGDAELLSLTNRLDRRSLESAEELCIDRQAMNDALTSLAAAQRDALQFAAQRIRDYHRHQLASSWDYVDEFGNRLGQRVLPLSRVGLYVPGGKASYPSSVLMNAIPARVAGVPQIIMTVPAPDGVLSPLVLAAAAVAEVDSIVTVGGAQAVAALAYGTETVPRVDKIVGPGNRYVAEAKRQVFGSVGIDMVAGPSEILILADGSVDPAWVAMDLFSQAEHDEQAQAILISHDPGYLDAVQDSIDSALQDMPRAEIIRASLAARGALITVPDMAAATALSNRIGPEHLELAVSDAQGLLPEITVAGAIFVGSMSSEALGDYCAGPNHVLPTSGTARFSSPLGVYDFQKRSSVIACSAQGAAALGRVASVLATGEGLPAHAASAELRVDAFEG